MKPGVGNLSTRAGAAAFRRSLGHARRPPGSENRHRPCDLGLPRPTVRTHQPQPRYRKSLVPMQSATETCAIFCQGATLQLSSFPSRTPKSSVLLTCCRQGCIQFFNGHSGIPGIIQPNDELLLVTLKLLFKRLDADIRCFDPLPRHREFRRHVIDCVAPRLQPIPYGPIPSLPRLVRGLDCIMAIKSLAAI